MIEQRNQESLAAMPVVTVEQITRFREASLREVARLSSYLEALTERMLEAEQQRDDLAHAASLVLGWPENPDYKDRLVDAIAKAQGAV